MCKNYFTVNWPYVLVFKQCFKDAYVVCIYWYIKAKIQEQLNERWTIMPEIMYDHMNKYKTQ